MGLLVKVPQPADGGNGDVKGPAAGLAHLQGGVEDVPGLGVDVLELPAGLLVQGGDVAVLHPPGNQVFQLCHSGGGLLGGFLGPGAIDRLLDVRAHGVGGQGGAAAPGPQVQPQGGAQQHHRRPQQAQGEDTGLLFGDSVEQFLHGTLPLQSYGVVKGEGAGPRHGGASRFLGPL